MPDTILFVNTMRVTPGELGSFQQKMQRALEFLEANGPQLMVNVYIDEIRLRASSFQLYADSASIKTHWHLSDPYIHEVMQHASVERLDIYGRPDESVMEQIRQFDQEGVEVSVTPALTGFHRLDSNFRG